MKNLFFVLLMVAASSAVLADHHHRRSAGHQFGLQIVDAYYGSDRRSCDAAGALRQCDGQGQCEVYASNRLCGDPHRGTEKTLVVRYSCGNGIETLYLREDDSTLLTCGGRTRAPFSGRQNHSRGIDILRADYGSGRSFCDASYAFAQQCNGRNECRVFVDNELCGDPRRGKRKFAEVEYRCGGRVYNEQIREESTAYLNCR
ncbi:MAG: hypothetical protein AB8B96_17910 [Lysobacterales bacterium]